MRRSRLLVVLALAAAGSPRRASAQSPRITLVTTPSDSGAEAYYSDALGLFAKAGLDVAVTTMNNGAAVAAAVVSGAAQIGQGNLVPLFAAHEHGLPFVLIAPGAEYTGGAPTSAIVVPKDSPVRDARDLVGKTVGCAGLRDIGQVGFDMWAVHQGVDPTSIRLIEMPSAQLATALARGDLAATVIIEPFLSTALAQGARILSGTHAAIAPHFLISAFFATRPWASANAAFVHTFAEATAATARWANANHARSAEILARYTQAQIAPNQVRATYAERLDPALVQPLIDAAARDHVLTTPFPAAALLP